MANVGDEHMGSWVYCKQHLRPHLTGWCTVDVTEKIALAAACEVDAYAECRARNLKLWIDIENGRTF